MEDKKAKRAGFRRGRDESAVRPSVKRKEYRVLWWCENVFSGGGEYVADEEVFTSKAKAIKHASYSQDLYRHKIQWRNKGTEDGWKWLNCRIPRWGDAVRRASRKYAKEARRLCAQKEATDGNP